MTRSKLLGAQAEGRAFVSLTIADRDGILAVIEDSPVGLEERRGVLLAEFVWRPRRALS